MLGQPPKYSSRPGDEESLPLKNSTFADEDEVDAIDRVPTPSYPPRHNAAGPSGSVQHNVRYTFNPRWPVKGKAEDALGVLGHDKDVSRGLLLLAAFYLLLRYNRSSTARSATGNVCIQTAIHWSHPHSRPRSHTGHDGSR